MFLYFANSTFLVTKSFRRVISEIDLEKTLE